MRGSSTRAKSIVEDCKSNRCRRPFCSAVISRRAVGGGSAPRRIRPSHHSSGLGRSAVRRADQAGGDSVARVSPSTFRNGLSGGRRRGRGLPGPRNG